MNEFTPHCPQNQWRLVRLGVVLLVFLSVFVLPSRAAIAAAAITLSDPVQTGRVFRDGFPSTCGATKAYPGNASAGTHHYDIYSYTNNSSASECVTVEITTACTTTNFIFSAAYLGSFNPTNISANYLADMGSSPNPTRSYSFNLGADQTAIINVHEVQTNGGCAAYSMSINGRDITTNTAPTITVNDVTVEADTAGGWTLDFSAIGTSSDAEDATAPSVVCTPTVGSVLPLGQTSVSCTATDSGGLTSSASGLVTVQDTVPPRITCPGNISGTVGQPISLGSPAASDVVDPNVSISNDGPASFGPGVTSVTWTARDASNNTATCVQTVTLRYNFAGFAQPIDNNGVLNVAKAGQAIPLKWRLTDANGVPVTNLTTVQVTVTSLSCASGTTPDVVEEYAAGEAGLQNLGNGSYQFNWKTPKSYAGSCKTLRLNLGDGLNRTALFQFK